MLAAGLLLAGALMAASRDLRAVAVTTSPAWLPLLTVPRAVTTARRIARRSRGGQLVRLVLAVSFFATVVGLVTMLAVGGVTAAARWGLLGLPAGHFDAEAIARVGVNFAMLNAVGVLPWGAVAWWVQDRRQPLPRRAPGGDGGSRERMAEDAPGG